MCTTSKILESKFLSPILDTLTLKASINYKLALAKSVCQWLNNNRTCHLPLWRLSPVLLQLLTLNALWGHSGWSEALCCREVWWNRSLDSKRRAWLHWTPLHQNPTYQLSPTTSLEQSLKAIWGAVSQVAVLILSQVKLNSRLSSCASFFTDTAIAFEPPHYRVICLKSYFVIP